MKAGGSKVASPLIVRIIGFGIGAPSVNHLDGFSIPRRRRRRRRLIHYWRKIGWSLQLEKFSASALFLPHFRTKDAQLKSRGVNKILRGQQRFRGRRGPREGDEKWFYYSPREQLSSGAPSFVRSSPTFAAPGAVCISAKCQVNRASARRTND